MKVTYYWLFERPPRSGFPGCMPHGMGRSGAAGGGGEADTETGGGGGGGGGGAGEVINSRCYFLPAQRMRFAFSVMATHKML